MLFKAIFIHLFSHFLDHEINLRYFPNQKSHDSNHENSCNDSSKGFLRHRLLSDMVWKSFSYKILLITSLLNQWINPAPVKLDLYPNQAELLKFQLIKIDSMKGIRFFWWRWITLIPNNIRSSCWPRVSYQEIFTDWITKESKPYCIKKRETVLVQVMKDVSKQVKLTVWKNRMKYEFLLPIGKNLRKVLIEKGVSPYSAFNNKINCRGNGLCATCGVFVMDSDPTPTHWHDRIARAFGYPRLSCQIEIREDMEIEIPPKWIWGKRKKRKIWMLRWPFSAIRNSNHPVSLKLFHSNTLILFTYLLFC